MEEHRYVVFLFPSVSYALKAEKILKAAGVAHKLIPVPRHISSDCGVCLRITEEKQQYVEGELLGRVEWDKVVSM
jgi:hypothetical protein